MAEKLSSEGIWKQARRRQNAMLFAMLIAAQLAGVAGAEDLPKDDAALTEHIFEQLERRRTQYPAFSYEICGTMFIPKGRHHGTPDVRPPGLSKPGILTPDRDSRLECRTMLHANLETGHLRKDVRSHGLFLPTNTYMPFREVHVFNHGAVTTLRPRNEQAVPREKLHPDEPELFLNEATPNVMGRFRSLADIPVYCAHGILFIGKPLLATLDVDLRPGDWSVQSRSESTVILTATFVNGSKRRKYVYGFDLARDCAVVSAEAYQDDLPIFRLAVSHEQSHGTWFPAAWALDAYNTKQQIMSSHRHSVQRIKLELDAPSPSVFKLPRRPGMVVRRDDALYRIAEDGASLVSIVEQRAPFSEEGWLVPAILTVLCALISVLFIRRRAVPGAQE